MQSPDATQRQRAIDSDFEFTGECAAEHDLARHRHPAACPGTVNFHQVPQVIPALRLRCRDPAPGRGVAVVEQQLVVVREQQIQVVEVAVGLPAQHRVVCTRPVLLHHEEQARRVAAQQPGSVHGRAEHVVRPVEYDGRLAIRTFAVERRLPVGFPLAHVMPERRSVRPCAHFAPRAAHAAPVKPQTQAKRGERRAVKHGRLDRVGC